MKKLTLLVLSYFCINILTAQIRVETITDEFPGSGGVKLDTEGNVYIGNFGDGLQNSNGNQIWKLDTEGNLTIFATGLSGASGNAFDSQGNLFQSNIAAGTVSKVTPSGSVSTFVTNRISCPVGIAIDKEDNLFVCNCCGQFANTITKVTPSGSASQFAASNLLACPNGITLDHEENLYVSNFNNGSVIKISPEGQTSFFASIPGSNNGHLTYSAIDSLLYVASHGSSRIYSLSLDKELEVIAGSGIRGNRDGDAATATFSRPNGVAITPSGDTLYVNSSIPTTNTNLPLNPSVLRRVTGVNPGIKTGVENISNFSTFHISPNPSQYYLSIDLSIKTTETLRFTISDTLGRSIETWKAEAITGKNKWEKNTTRLPKGIYILTISNAQDEISRRFEKL